jgi:hypothetical protein
MLMNVIVATNGKGADLHSRRHCFQVMLQTLCYLVSQHMKFMEWWAMQE